MSNQILISSGAKLRDLDDVIIGTDGVLTSVGFDVPYGVPRLDSNGKILVSELPNSVMEFKGVWNAATNTPTLTDGVGNAGDVYLCNVAGTVNFGTGPIVFAVGDYAVYTGTVWARSSGATGTVTSVAVSKDGDALAITGSPITTSGTINIGFTGNNLQYINGAGNLVTFPTLTGYVPYTGATSDVDLGTYGLKGDYIGFNTTPSSVPTTLGTLSWDAFYRTLQLITGDGDTTLQIGQEQVTLVHNNTGSTLVDGQVVYVTGSTGELPSVALASNTSEATSSVTFGVVTESIANGADGFITTSGIVHGLNTLAFNEGDAIWLGSTAGTFTNVKPIAPLNSVLIGYVIKKAGGNGSIFVKIQNGYELEELHDVLITSVADGDILQWNSATSLWENVAGSTTNIAEGSNLYFTDARARAAISLTTTGSTGPATYNSTTGVLNIPNYVDQYVGTVTSVGLSAPTGFSVSGSPVTSSGTLALSFASGYSLPTNVKQSNWDDAYTWVAAFPTQTGNAGKFLTTDGSTLSWATVIAGVQSVTASSPLFSSGGANPNITIQVANTSQNGYLSSTDWNTFNGKQAGSTNLTSLAGLTYASTSFVKMTAAGTFALDTNTYALASALGNYLPLTGGTLTNTGSNQNPILRFASSSTDVFQWITQAFNPNVGTGNTMVHFIGQAASTLNSGYFGFKWIADQSASNYLSFGFFNSDHLLRLYGSGNVVINGSADAGYRLDVNGTGRFTSRLNVNNAPDDVDIAMTVKAQSGSGKFIMFGRDASDLAVFKLSSTGAATFSRNDTSNISVTISNSYINQGNLINFQQNKAGATINAYIGHGGDNSGNFVIFNDAIQRMAITPTGRYGFNTPSPSRHYVFSNPDNRGAGGFEINATDSLITFLSYNRSTNTYLPISISEGSSSVLVGTNTGVSGGGALQVNGNVNINGVFQINGVTIGGGGGSGVTGSGTTGYVPRWTSTSSLGNSVIYDNGTNVSIGSTANNGTKLQVYTAVTGDNPAIDAIVTGTGRFLRGLRVLNSGMSAGTDLMLSLGQSESARNMGQFYFYWAGNNSTASRVSMGMYQLDDVFNLFGSGNIVIGSTTDNGYRLQINGSASFAYGYLSVYRGSSSPNDILVGNDGSRFYIGGNTYAAGSVTATGGFFDTSDARLKTLIEDNYLLSSIANVKAKLYTKGGRKELGYYAQDLLEILPNAVSEGADGFLSLSYAQVHTAKIAVIEDEVTMLKNRVSELEKQLNLN